MTTNNDQVLLKQVITQTKTTIAANLSDSDFFEQFVAEQALKDFDLTNDEIEVGLTGRGNDGGIDGFFTFVNEKILLEDTDLTTYKKGVTLDIYIIQAKRSEGFEGTALDKLIVTTKKIFDLSKSLTSLKSIYNEKLLQTIGYFRYAHEKLATKFPKLRISYIYASLGDAQNVHPNVQRKVDSLQDEIKTHFSHSEFNFSFLGAKELLEYFANID